MRRMRTRGNTPCCWAAASWHVCWPRARPLARSHGGHPRLVSTTRAATSLRKSSIRAMTAGATASAAMQRLWRRRLAIFDRALDTGHSRDDVETEYRRVADGYEQLHSRPADEGYADQNRHVLEDFDRVTAAYRSVEAGMSRRSVSARESARY